MARGLKLASTGAVGFLVPSLRNTAEVAIIRGAFHRAWERNFVVLLAEDTDEDGSPTAYTRLVEEGRIDGMLIASARDGSGVVEQFAAARFPCVFVNRRHPGGRCNVSMHEERAGEIAANHLLALGHRRLALLAGPEDLDTAQRMADGFIDAARAAGVDPLIVRSAFEERQGREAMLKVLAERPRPTAIFISNLNQAIGAIAAARDAGARVPTELSILACDDDPILEFFDVPTTTIRMPLWELGVVGVDALLAQIGGENPRDVVVGAEPELIVRASTAPPAA